MFGIDLKIAGIAGAIAFVVGGIAAGVTYEKLIVPGRLADERAAVTKMVTESVTKERDAICAQTVSDATAIATKAAADRERRNADAAMTNFAAAAAAREAAAARQIEQLESEANDYAQKLKDAGRACALDLGDIEWLRAHGLANKPVTP